IAQFRPEYLKCVPEFDGKPNDLNRYLLSCQSLIDNFYNAANQLDFRNVFLLNSLIGKLTGTAKIIVNIQNVTTWDDLKAVIKMNNYHVDSDGLDRKMRNMKTIYRTISDINNKNKVNGQKKNSDGRTRRKHTRKNYIQSVYNKAIKQIREEIGSNYIWFAVDKTTDVCGRYIANLIVGVMHEEEPRKGYLICSEGLEAISNNNVSRI
ncbi:hypothetical protein YQE_08708, partial [Dendroctonus ponderosae]